MRALPQATAKYLGLRFVWAVQALLGRKSIVIRKYKGNRDKASASTTAPAQEFRWFFKRFVTEWTAKANHLPSVFPPSGDSYLTLPMILSSHL